MKTAMTNSNKDEYQRNDPCTAPPQPLAVTRTSSTIATDGQHWLSRIKQNSQAIRSASPNEFETIEKWLSLL